MNSIMSTAISGMTMATRRLETSAANIARPGADVAAEAVDQMVAEITFKANAEVLRTTAQMTKQLLDIRV